MYSLIHLTNTHVMSGTTRHIRDTTVSTLPTLSKPKCDWNTDKEIGIINHMTSAQHEKYQATGEHTYKKQN